VSTGLRQLDELAADNVRRVNPVAATDPDLSGLAPMARTVLIVDDHASFRAAARQLMELQGFDVVGVATDAASAVEAARVLHPDVVLLDVQLPDGDGFRVSEELAALGCSAQIVLVSSRLGRDYGSRLAGASVAGFISKDKLSPETIGAVLAV